MNNTTDLGSYLNHSSTNFDEMKPFYEIMQIVFMIMSLLNILLHSFGIYLLVHARDRNNETSQSLYIINMALTEILWNLPDFLYRFISTSTSSFVFLDIYLDFSFYIYYAAMVLIVCNRLYQTVAPFRYRGNWTSKKTKISIAIGWLFSFFITFSLYLADTKNLKYIINDAYPLSLLIIYLIFSISAYISMFVVFVRTRRRTQTNHHLSVWTIFKNSRFYFSFLLVGSYLILTVIPWICHYTIVRFIVSRRYFYQFLACINACYLLSSTVDFFLYVFAQKSVRKTFIKKCLCCRREPQTNTNNRNEIELRLIPNRMTTTKTTTNTKNETHNTL